jgi:hypothetical protein
MKRSMMKSFGAGLFGAAMLLGGIDGVKAAVPGTVAFSGRLSDVDGLVEGSVDITFRLFDAASNGTEVWTETHQTVADQGLVLVELGSDTALDETIFDGSDLYLEIEVNGDTLSPRSPVGSVPYALRAAVADRLGSLGPSDVQARVNGACGANEAIQSINADGSVTCQVDDDTTYAEGIGIDITGNVVSADLAAVQARVNGACPAGQAIRTIGSAGAVVCEADDNTTYTEGAGIDITGTTVSADTAVVQSRVTGSCLANQAIRVINSDGTVSCDAENVTGAGSGLSLAGGLMSIASSGVTSSHISNGTIDDVDISSSAGINPSKIDGGTQGIEHSGNCGTFVRLNFCVAGEGDGPPCNAIGLGQMCEYDAASGCTGGLSDSEDNCGTFDWYMRI